MTTTEKFWNDTVYSLREDADIVADHILMTKKRSSKVTFLVSMDFGPNFYYVKRDKITMQNFYLSLVCKFWKNAYTFLWGHLLWFQVLSHRARNVLLTLLFVSSCVIFYLKNKNSNYSFTKFIYSLSDVWGIICLTQSTIGINIICDICTIDITRVSIFSESRSKRPLRIACTTVFFFSFLTNCIFSSSVRSIFLSSQYETSFKNICDYLRNDYKFVYLQEFYPAPNFSVNFKNVIFRFWWSIRIFFRRSERCVPFMEFQTRNDNINQHRFGQPSKKYRIQSNLGYFTSNIAWEIFFSMLKICTEKAILCTHLSMRGLPKNVFPNCQLAKVLERPGRYSSFVVKKDSPYAEIINLQ